MPSLPTSLILLGLVAAWLVVLVPMVARRREEVPENDEDAAGFRVLRRASASLRRRPVLSRTARGMDADEAERDDVDSDLLVDSDASDEARDVGDEARDADAEDPAGDERDESEDWDVAERESADVHDGAVAVEDVAADDVVADDVVAGGTDDDGTRVGGARGRRRSGRGRRRESEYQRVEALSFDSDEVAEPERESRREQRRAARVRDAADDWNAVNNGRQTVTDRRSTDAEVADASRYGTDAEVAEAEPSYTEQYEQEYPVVQDEEYAGAPDRDRRSRNDYQDEPDSSLDYRPVPIRHGRGGFDPDAAARAQAYRYRARRRVVLTLVALTVIGALLGWLGFGAGWVGAGVTTVLVAMYLAYLRRQVRIENEIRARRAARLERARQIRPGYRPSVAEQVRAHRGLGDGADYRVVSHARPTVPPSYQVRGVPVDLDDDDPAFDELEYYEPMPYRRAVGQ